MFQYFEAKTLNYIKTMTKINHTHTQQVCNRLNYSFQPLLLKNNCLKFINGIWKTLLNSY